MVLPVPAEPARRPATPPARRSRADRRPTRRRRFAGPRRRWSAGHRALAGRRDVHLYIPWHLNVTDRLTDLDELRSSWRRMPFESPSFGPLIRGVVMIDVAEQETGSCPVDDQPDVATDPNGLEVLVLCPVDLVQLQARMRRVHRQVERRGLDRLLLVTGQLVASIDRSHKKRNTAANSVARCRAKRSASSSWKWQLEKDSPPFCKCLFASS